MDLSLPPPEWAAIFGGSDQEARWIADRDRKFGLIADMTADFMDLSRELEARGLLFHATPAVLAELPGTADWYVSLAGYALNTLGNVRQGPETHGLTVRASTVRRNLTAGRSVSEEQRTAFAAWINAELEKLYPPEKRTPDVARAVVFAILGGRCIGMGQNVGGDDGVLLLKRLFVSAMRNRGHPVELLIDESWVAYEEEASLEAVAQIRFAGRITCDFTGGGSRPDIDIKDRALVIGKGEVKARKDTSNVWESWMPSIENHLRTWAADAPDSVRLFFGTLVTSDMIDGTTHRGTYRAGLKRWHENGLLQNAYNTTKIMADDPAARRTFDALLDGLEARLER